MFAGIGGIDLGFERAGMTCKWQVEWDEYCQRVLAKHWPNVPRYGDVAAIDWQEVEPVDVVAGGFPCQPASISGHRRGHEDERWLWPDFAACVAGLRPRFVVIENVPGLASRGLGEVVTDLAALGYDAEWQVVSAAAVGAPQLRERIWVVAYADRPVAPERGQLPAGPGEGTGWPDGSAGGGEVRREGRAAGAGQAAGARVFTDPPSAAVWAEPEPLRVADGLPGRLDQDRLKALGNAVVPQVAEFVGRQLLREV